MRMWRDARASTQKRQSFGKMLAQKIDDLNANPLVDAQGGITGVRPGDELGGLRISHVSAPSSWTDASGAVQTTTWVAATLPPTPMPPVAPELMFAPHGTAHFRTEGASVGEVKRDGAAPGLPPAVTKKRTELQHKLAARRATQTEREGGAGGGGGDRGDGGES